MRLYRRTYGLRQIVNIANYIVHSACTIHLLNLPEKTAKRDIVHGVKHLEEIAEDWLCARRTLSILSLLARKWKVTLPEEAATVFARTDHKYGSISTASSPKSDIVVATPPHLTSPPQVPRAIQNNFNSLLSRTDLSNSIYGYTPDMQPPLLKNGTNSASTQAQTSMNSFTPIQSSKQPKAGESMNVNNESVLSMSYPRQPYGIAPSRPLAATGTDLRRSDSSGISEATSSVRTRQVSPTTLFGGVDTLLENQDWWLKDQANLAVGFDNWMGVDMNGDGVPSNGNGTGNETTASPEMMGNEYFMPAQNGANFPDIDWSTYS